MMELYLISGLALHAPATPDYRVRQLAAVVPASDEGDALTQAAEQLAALAPLGEGWEGHTIRVALLEPIQEAYAPRS